MSKTKEERAREYIINKQYCWEIEGLEDMLDSEADRDFKNGWSICSSIKDKEIEELKGDLAWLLRRLRTYIHQRNHKHLHLDIFEEKVKDIIKLEGIEPTIITELSTLQDQLRWRSVEEDPDCISSN